MKRLCDFINISPNGVVYTVKDNVAEKADEVLNELGYDPVLKEHCAKVSVVGAGIAGVPGVASKIVTAFRNKVFIFYNQQIVIRQFGCWLK